jgi:hypothetical protein
VTTHPDVTTPNHPNHPNHPLVRVLRRVRMLRRDSVYSRTSLPAKRRADLMKATSSSIRLLQVKMIEVVFDLAPLGNPPDSSGRSHSCSSRDFVLFIGASVASGIDFDPVRGHHFVRFSFRRANLHEIVPSRSTRNEDGPQRREH